MRSTLRRMESDSSPMESGEGIGDGSKAAEAEEARGDGIVAEGEDEGAEAREIEEGSIWRSCSRIAAHSSLQRMHWRASAAFKASEAVCWAVASRLAALNTTLCSVCSASASAAADSAASASAWHELHENHLGGNEDKSPEKRVDEQIVAGQRVGEVQQHAGEGA